MRKVFGGWGFAAETKSTALAVYVPTPFSRSSDILYVKGHILPVKRIRGFLYVIYPVKKRDLQAASSPKRAKRR